MTYWVTSTTGLMDRTPARRNRSRIQTGVVARLLTPWITQPTNVGQAAGAAKWTAAVSRDGSAPAATTALAPVATATARGPEEPAPTPFSKTGPAPVSSSAHASMVSGCVASNTS